MRGGPSLPRQSRLDQYRAQHVEKSPIKTDRCSGLLFYSPGFGSRSRAIINSCEVIKGHYHNIMCIVAFIDLN